MKRFFLIAALALLSFAFLNADVYIKTKTHTDAFEFMGQQQPAKDEITEQWIAADKFTYITSSQTMVVDLSKKVLYVIYPENQKYVEATLPLDISKLLPEQYAQMMNMVKVNVNVTPTGETKTIGQWNCQGYDVNINMTIMTIKMKYWVTKDVPLDWKTYTEKLYTVFMKAKMVMLDGSSLAEFKKIEGFQVAGEITMSVMEQRVRTVSNVLEISQKPAPADIYSVPAGYTKQERLTLEQGF